MPPPELRMSFADRAALEREVSTNLKHGRAFVAGAAGIDVLADCVLVLVHPEHGATLAVPGQAVFVSATDALRGVGVELRPFDAGVASTLEAFVNAEPPTMVLEPVAEQSGEAVAVVEPCAEGNGSVEAPASITPGDAVPIEAAAAQVAPDSDGDGSEGEALDDDHASDVQQKPAIQERMRKLSVTEQQKIARGGELNDRVMLERIYGKAVWDGLLHNPKLTLPEVARIARKGTIPRPLLELIVDNNAWIQAPIVRRALLGNPRTSGESIMKLLRITPKHELRAIYKTTTYSNQVREAARKVLDL